MVWALCWTPIRLILSSGDISTNWVAEWKLPCDQTRQGSAWGGGIVLANKQYNITLVVQFEWQIHEMKSQITKNKISASTLLTNYSILNTIFLKKNIFFVSLLHIWSLHMQSHYQCVSNYPVKLLINMWAFHNKISRSPPNSTIKAPLSSPQHYPTAARVSLTTFSHQSNFPADM